MLNRLYFLATLAVVGLLTGAGPIIWNGSGIKDISPDAVSSTTGKTYINDGTGALTWGYPSSAINYVETFDPANASSTRNTLQSNIVPVAGSAGSNITIFNVSADDTSAFALNGYNVLNLGANSAGSGNKDYVTVVNASTTIGNGTDPVTVNATYGWNHNIAVANQATVGGVNPVNIGVAGAVGSVITNYNGVSDGSSFDEVASVTGHNFVPTVTHATNNVVAFNFGGTVTDGDQNVTGMAMSPNIVNADAVYGANISGNWTTINGGAAFQDVAQITTQANTYMGANFSPNITTSNNYSGVNVGPNITTSSGFTGFNHHPQIATQSGTVQAIEDGTNVTVSTQNYNGLNFHPNLTLVTDNFKGFSLTPNATGDGSGDAVGVYVDMTNVTNFSPDQVKAAQLTGNVQVTGILNAQVDFPIANNGGSPQPVHSINSVFTAADNAVIASADRFNFAPVMTVQIGDNATITSGGFGLGQASLGMVDLFQIGAGSSLDAATGSFIALVGAGGSGTLQNMTGYRVVPINSGSTITLDNFYAYKYDDPAGAWATTSWGLYSQPSYAENWIGGHLKIGGTAGTTDRVSNAGLALEVEGASLFTGEVAAGTLALNDTDSAFDLSLQSTSTLTADRTLTFDVNDAARTVSLGGNVTTAGALTTAGANALTLTTTGATNVTFPTTGTLSTLAGTETLTNKTINGATLNEVGTFTILDDTDQDGLITIRGIDVGTGANRALTFDMNDGSRTLNLNGGLNLASTFTTAGAFSTTLTSTGVTNVTLPLTGTVATLAGSETFSNKTLASPIVTTAATLNAQAELRLADANSSNYVGFKSPDPVAANVIWTLPAADGTANQVLSTDGAGLLSWASTATNPLTTNGDIIYGVGATPTRLAAGTANQVLHSGAVPSWGAVSLTADVSGTLPVANGGTGIASGTSGGIPYFSGSTTIASSAALAANKVVLGGGAGVAPASQTNLTYTASQSPYSGTNFEMTGKVTSTGSNATFAAINGFEMNDTGGGGYRWATISEAGSLIFRAGNTGSDSPFSGSATTHAKISNTGGVTLGASGSTAENSSNGPWRTRLNSGGTWRIRGQGDTVNVVVIDETMANTTAGTSDPVGVLIQKGSSTTTSAQHFVDFYTNAGGATNGYIGSNGANNAAFFATSDRRLKKDIEPLSGGLAKVVALNPVNFKWRKDDASATGFIAQEFAKVLPAMVGKTDDGSGEDLPEGSKPWHMTESGALPYLVSAIKELKAENDALKQRLEASGL